MVIYYRLIVVNCRLLLFGATINQTRACGTRERHFAFIGCVPYRLTGLRPQVRLIVTGGGRLLCTTIVIHTSLKYNEVEYDRLIRLRLLRYS